MGARSDCAKPRGRRARRRSRAPLRPRSLTIAVCAALGAPLPSLADVSAVPGGPTTVGSFVPDGAYSTGHDVSTSLVRNSVGLNRFAEFGVDADTHVRLNLPASADALVNLIESAGRAEVHGLVQGIEDGEVGGRLYFASPAGFFVGTSGRIEAGSLTITTPTEDFLGDFLDDFDGGGLAVARMLSGDVPLSAAGVIEIQGHLEAENSVLLYSRRVTVSGNGGGGAGITVTGAAGSRGAELFQRLVNTGGFLAGSAIAETAGGALVIVAEQGGVVIGPGATLDAGDGGLLITAADLQRPADGPLPAIEDWFRPSRSATATVEVDGVLRGNEVVVVAAAEAVTEWRTPLDTLEDVADLSPDLQQLMQDAKAEIQQGLPALDGAVAIANADATVRIGPSARIESDSDVTLEARAHRSATAQASAEDGAWLGAAAAYGRISGETRVEVEEGAAIAAPGALALLAASENTLLVSAESSANQGTSVSLSGTVAVSEADVSTVAELNAGTDGGADLVGVDRVSITATSENSYSTEATSSAADGLAIGLAAAVSLIESETRATLSGTLELGGGLAMLAHSRTHALNTVAATEAGAPADEGGEGSEEGEDKLGGWIGSLLGDASDGIAADENAADDTPASGSDGGLPLKIGSAVAYVDARETAVAEVAEATAINTPDPDPVGAAGDVTVIARRELDGFRNHASSAAVSEGASDEGGTSVSISAAVALGFVDHAATARIGDGAAIHASRLGLAADLHLGPNAAWGEDDGFTGIGDFGGDGGDTDSLNSYASASIDGSDTAAISGAVAYLDLDSRASATVGDGVVIGVDDSDDWSTAFGGEDDPVVEWGGALSIHAAADVRTVDLAGNASGSGKVGIGGAVAWIDRSTTVEALVGHDSALDSAGDVHIDARRRDEFIVLAPVSGTGAGEDSVASLNAAVAYGRFRGVTGAGLGYGTSVIAGGDFSLLADTHFEAEVATVSTLEAGGTFALAGTVAYADIDQTTHARQAAVYPAGYTPQPGAESRVAAGSVTIAATSAADYTVSATGKAESRVAVGLAAAVADIAGDTHAGLAGSVETGGDVVVLADSLTGTRSLRAETRAAAPTEEEAADEEVPGEVAQDGTAATDFAQRRSESADEQASADVEASESGAPGSGGGGGSGQKNFDLRLSGAVAVLVGEERARATVADGATIGSSADRAGDVVILARRQENGLRTRVESATEAKVKDANGTGIAVSAAVSFVDLDNEASAVVGRNATIHGGRIGVGSLVALPDHFRLPGLGDIPDWDVQDDLDTFRQKAIESGEALVESWFTTWASASASSQNSTVDVAGAVNYVNLTNVSAAWVDDGATLDATGVEGGWDHVIRAADGEAEEDAWTFGETVAVDARSEVATIDLAGNLAGLTGFGVDADGTTAAIGGAFAWVERSNSTVAGLGADVTVTVPDGALRVSAGASDRAITLAPTSGRGADYAVNGTAAVTRIDHLTAATLHHSADVTAGAVDVNAELDLTIWSVAGAVALGENLGVGLGSAVNDLATRTVALIGDNRDDRPDVLEAGDAGGGPGEIRADRVDVAAATRGLAGTAAVAGAGAGGQQAQGGSNAARAGFDGRTSEVQDDAGEQSADDALEGPADDLVAGQTDGGQGLEGDDSTKSGASFSIAGSGSAAVNLTELGTEAGIEGADISGRDDGSVTVAVRALNDTDLLALSGAGALVRDSGGGGGFSAAIAGAVAINQLENVTRARVVDSEITRIGGAAGPGVSVEAMTAGELIGVGLGLAVNTTSGGGSSLSAAGSVSLGMLRNQTVAGVDGSTLEGEGGGEAVRVVAYDRSRIATGGGALTWGGRVGLGVALTYADIGNTTRASVLDSDVLAVDALDIGAFSASRIISAAVGLQLSTDANQGVGIAGSVAVNRIHNHVGAELGGEGGSTVDAAGTVTVQAASVSGDDFDTLLAGLEGAASDDDRHDVNWSGEDSEIVGAGEPGAGGSGGTHENQEEIDDKYAEFAADASLGGVLEGEAIVGIAGNIQASKNQNSIGLAFTGNVVDNVYEAVIDNATVTADEVIVDAVQSARILGIAAGAAITNGKFAGLGSGVANIIGLDDDAGRVHAGIADSTINAGNIAVRGLNGSRIDAAAGSVAYSGKAAIGAAIGYNEIATATTALVEDSILRGRAGADSIADSLGVAALATGDIYALAVAGAASQGVALAGSANINRLGQAVTAGIRGATLTVSDVDVGAGNAGPGAAAGIWALTGNVSLGSQVAAGAAFAWNEIQNVYTAEVVDSGFDALDALEVEAVSSGKVRTLTAAGALSTGSLAVTGAGAYSVIDADTGARIENSAIADSGADVHVFASDDADIASIAASLAVGTGSAAGAGAIAVNEMKGAVTAEVLGGAGGHTLHTGALLVDAMSDTQVLTIGAGIGASSQVGLAGSSAVNLVETEVLARIAGGALIDASGDVGVRALSTDQVQLIAGSLGIGVSALGAAATVAVNMLEGSTAALIEGAGTRVTAPGGGGIAIGSGSLDGERDLIDYGLPDAPGGGGSADTSGDEAALSNDYVAGRLGETQEVVRGVAVSAGSMQSVGSYIATAGINPNLKSGVALAGAVGVNLLERATTAAVRDARIDTVGPDGSAGADLTVRASAHAETRSLVIGAALSSVGAAAAVASDVFDRTTVAEIVDADVSAHGNVVVDAVTTQTANAMSFGAAVGTWAGVAGGGVLMLMEGTNTAAVVGGHVEAGGLFVDADYRNVLNLTTANAAISGGAAAAGSFAVGVIESENLAIVDGADLDLADTLSIQADTWNELHTIAASGAASAGTSIAGMASVSLIGSRTFAYLQDSTVDGGDGGEGTLPTGAVLIGASDSLASRSWGGGVSLGYGNALGASATVVVGKATVEAASIDSDVHAGHMTVDAERRSDVEAYTITAAAGGGLTIGAGIGVILLGGNGVAGIDTVDDPEAANQRTVADELDNDDGSTLDQLDSFGAGQLTEGDDPDTNQYGEIGLSDDRKDRIATATRHDVGSAVRDGGEHETRATVSGGTLFVGGLDVSASEGNRTVNAGGALAVGIAGVGGAAAVTHVASVVRASVDSDVTLTGPAGIDIGAESGATSELISSAFNLNRYADNAGDSIGGDVTGERTILVLAAAGSAGVVGVGAAYADGRAASTVSAELGGQVTRDGGAAPVNVGATDGNSIGSYGIGAAAGAAAAGLVVGFAEKTSVVTAEVLSDAHISGPGSVALDADAGGVVTARGAAAAGGLLLAGSGSIIIASDSGTARAAIREGVRIDDAGAVVVTANVTPRTDVKAYAAALGAVAIGVSWAEARASALAEALIGDDVVFGGASTAVTLDAGTAPATGYAAEAEAWAAGGAYLLSASGAIARANDTTQAHAVVGDGVRFETGGDVTVTSHARPAARAVGHGYSGAAVGAFGVALADARASGVASSVLGDDVAVDGNANLVVEARVTPGAAQTASAESTTGAGAGLVGAVGARATAVTTTTAEARTGSGLRLPGGDIWIEARNDTRQLAQGSGRAGAAIAVGLVDVRAESDTATRAILGHSAQAAGNRAGNITIRATGSNVDRANAVSGTGGIIAGSAAETETRSVGDVLAEIAECGPSCPSGQDRVTLRAGRVSVEAAHVNDFHGTVNSRSAHLAGYSGARARHTATANVTTRVGTRANLDLLFLNLDAQTRTVQPAAGSNIDVGAGGALNASAGTGSTTVNANARVEVGEDAVIRTFRLGDASGEGDIRMRAFNALSTYQYGKLDTGGVIDIPKVDIVATATLTGTIDIGAGATVGAAQDLVAVAWSEGSMEAYANVRTHGLAGAASGTTAATLDATHHILIRGDGTLAANRDVFLGAGLDAARGVGTLSALADTYIWNKTAFPVKTDPTADARLVANNFITVNAGGVVSAGRDAELVTTWQQYHARGVGIGKDLWREVAEKVTNTVVKIFTFGQVKKAVSLEIRKGTSTVLDTDRITVDGTVIGGASAYQYLWITDEVDANGDPVIFSSLGINYEITERDILQDLQTQLLYYESLMQQYAEQESALFWRAYAQAYTIQGQIQALENLGLQDEDGNPLEEFLVRAVELKDIETRGGNVILNTGALSGTGRVSLGEVPSWQDVEGAPVGALTPESALSVRLVNESGLYLYVGDVEMGETVGDIVLHTRTPGTSFLLGGRYQFSVDLSNATNWNGVEISGGGSSAVPEVHIVNTWQGPPLVDESAPPEPFLPPEIHLLGNIGNAGGLVSVSNATGSIIVSGNIDADTVRIAAGGGLIQNFTTGFRHLGGAPDATTPPSESQIVAGGAIYISGEYVNINGLVRSGVAEYDLTISQALLEDRLAAAPADQNEVYLSGLFDDGSLNLNELRAYYDRERDAIVVRKAEVRPGYIFIFGDVVSTGGGRLEAVSGYGDIRLDNQTGKAVILEGLDVGTGGNGIIEILDMGYAELPSNLPDPDGAPGPDDVVNIPSPRQTIYEHDWQTDTLHIRQSYLNAVLSDETLEVISNPIGSDTLENTRGTFYQPVEGRHWDRQTTLIVDEAQFRFLGFTVTFPVFSVENQEVLVSAPTASSMAADVPIAINFLGGSEGRLEVESVGDVRLSGELRNVDGAVSLTTQGGVFNPGVMGGIVAERIDVSARTGIGTGIAPLQLEVGSGAARVTTDRNDIYLRGRGSDLLLDHVRSDRGDLYVYSEHDILDAGSHPEAAVMGRSITLESFSGSIGSADQPLRIATGHVTENALEDLLAQLRLALEQFFSGLGFLGFKAADPAPAQEPAPVRATLTASAETGAWIEETAGDLHVNLVEVRDGDVLLRVREGSLINALGRGELDLERLEQLTALWQDMRLLGDDAAAAAQESVEGYQAAVTAQYFDYWLLRDFVDADAETQSRLENVFSSRYLDPKWEEVIAARIGDADAAAALVEGLTGNSDLETLRLRTAYELEHLEGVLKTELGVDDLSGVDGFDQRDDDWIFAFDADDPRIAAIVEGAEWSEEELLNSINADALIDTDSTLYELVQPNVIGNNVTIETAGSVGSFDEPIRIDLPDDDADPDAYPDLTADQIAALLAAQPGDISFEGGTFNPVTGEFEGDITAIIIGRTLVVGVDAGGPDGAGGLTLGSGGNAFIVSPFQSLRLNDVTAPGDVRIQVRGDIVAADHGLPVITGAAAGLLLEAEGGSIGSADRAIYVNLDDAPFVTARAAEGIYLVSQSGDLRIDRMNTLAGTLFLVAEDGSIIARDDDLLDLAADDIHLEASGDITGGSGDSGFDGINVRMGEGGLVSGRAGGAFRVAALEGTLGLRDVASGEETSVLATGALSADTVDAGGDFDATSLEATVSVRDVRSGGEARVRAAGAITAETIDAGGDFDAVSLEGTVSLGDVRSGGKAAVWAAGAITGDSIDAGGDFTATSIDGTMQLDDVSSGGDVTLSAYGALTAVMVDALGSIHATSSNGAMLLRGAGSGGDTFGLASGTLTADTVDAGGTVRLESLAGDVILDLVQARAAGAGAIEIVSAREIQGGLPVPDVGPAGLDAPQDVLHYHVAARGADAGVRLTAAGDIGQEPQHLTLVAPNLEAFSATGSIWITALGTVLTGTVDARNGAMGLHGRDGLGTREPLALRVRDTLDLRANDVRADIVHTANPTALPMTLQRIDGGELDTAELWVDAPNGLALLRMHGREIMLETSASRVEVRDGRVLESFEYRTPDAHVYMHNIGVARHRSANVHLYQPDFDFFAIQDGRFTYTNSHVVYYAPGYQVRVPNYVPDHRNTRHDVDGRAGERQAGAWVSDLSDGERRSAGDGVAPVDFAALVATAEGWTLAVPGDLAALEETGALVAAFGTPLIDREAIALREQRAVAIRELAQNLASRNVQFAFDAADLDEEDEAFLDYVAGVLADQPRRRVRIEGHTDAVGEAPYNQRLSEARASVVREYLMARGVRPEQMEFIGAGASRAIASNDTPEGRQANRRVEITLLPAEQARRQ